MTTCPIRRNSAPVDSSNAERGTHEQKYYLHDPATGEIAGLYLWESQEALTVYRESELRASIAEAYQAEGEPRVEVYRVVKTRRDDRD